MVSFGNQIDLRVEDFLEYFAEDRNIRLIACYIEDIKDSRRFLKALGRTTARKAVVILKGGRTETGAKAAESHTGALSGNDFIWTTAVRQYGAILVEDFDQMMNLVMLATAKKAIGGKGVGFLGAGGGISVLFSDLAVKAGLSLPALQENTRQKIARVIQGVNTSTANPVDLGAFGFDLQVMLLRLGSEADFLDLDDRLALPGYLNLLALLVAELAVIHDPAHRRLTVRRDLDKVQTSLLGLAHRLFLRDNPDLVVCLIDQPNLVGSDPPVNA